MNDDNNILDPIRNPKEVRRHFRFIFKNRYGGPVVKVLYGQDLWEYNTLEDADAVFYGRWKKLERRTWFRYELTQCDVSCRKDFISSGLNDGQIDALCEEFGIPDENVGPQE